MNAALIAQTPAYFVIGEDELKNEDIYSVTQASDETIYVGTNSGGFVYRHGAFKRIKPSPDQVGSAVFQFEESREGDIFCYNMSGQIFRLKNDALYLVFTIPKKHINRNMIYFFLPNGKILFLSGDLMLLDFKSKELLVLKKGINVPGRIISPIGKTDDGKICFHDSRNFYVFLNGTLHTHSIYSDQEKKGILEAFILKNKIFYVSRDWISKNQFLKEWKNPERKNNFIIRKSYRSIHLNKKEYNYSRRTTKGLDFLFLDKDSTLQSEYWFPDTFISTIGTGEHPLTLLGTFKKGIYVIPNPKIKSDRIVPEDDNCRNFCVKNDTLFFVTEKQHIYRFDKERKLLFDSKTNERINFIFYAEGSGDIHHKKTRNLIFSNKNVANIDYFLSNVKDIYQKKSGDIIIAHVNGLRQFSNNNPVNKDRWNTSVAVESTLSKGKLFDAKNFRKRISKISYDETRDMIYYVSGGTLYSFDKKGVSEIVLLQKNNIKATDLENHNDTIYVGTYGDGIVRIINGIPKNYFNKTNGIHNEYIRQVKFSNNRLFILHQEGIQIYETKTGNTYPIGIPEGVDNTSILNIDVERNNLYVNTGSDIIKVNVDKIKQEFPDFNLTLDSVMVNENRVKEGKNKFHHREKNISFHTNFKNILLDKETQLWHKLEGTNTPWENRPIHEHTIKYKSLSPGDYKFRAYAQFRDSKSEEILYFFKIRAPIWQRWWFIPSIIGFLTGIIYLYFKQREKKEKELNRIRLEKEVAEREQIESELKALRSQMNPHFIFNSLNSIQDLILREETDKSYDYIVLFSDLVRNTLNHSNKKFIPIEKELEFLEIYLGLEKLRFKEDFNYLIDYEGSTGIEIPSLLVQPFVENALLHGLLHKSGEKRLEIKFRLTEDRLECNITDNGIGRDKAHEIRQRQRPGHQSFSMDAIKKRLDFLGSQYGMKGGYTFKDLFENGQAVGTRVELFIPFKRTF